MEEEVCGLFLTTHSSTLLQTLSIKGQLLLDALAKTHGFTGRSSPADRHFLKPDIIRTTPYFACLWLVQPFPYSVHTSPRS